MNGGLTMAIDSYHDAWVAENARALNLDLQCDAQHGSEMSAVVVVAVLVVVKTDIAMEVRSIASRRSAAGSDRWESHWAVVVEACCSALWWMLSYLS